MRRLLLVAAVAVLLVAGLTVAYWSAVMHGLGVQPRTPSTTYNWWSGSGSVLVPPILTLIGVAALFWWHHQCHDNDCLRYARYEAAGGTFRYCHRHHPDAHPDHGFADPHHRHRLHHEWRARNTAPPGPDPGTNAALHDDGSLP